MRAKITTIVDGVKYDTEKAVVIASDVYGMGWDQLRKKRHTHLYKTGKNNYFAGYSTQWQGERDHIDVLSKEEAMALYEILPDHEVDYEDAFEVKPEEASITP